MKGAPRLTGLARIIGFLAVLALLIGLLAPLAGVAAQESNDELTTEALAEVPSTGASRLCPVTLARSLVPR